MNKLLSLVTAAAILMVAGCDLLTQLPGGKDDEPDKKDTGIKGVINSQSSSSLKSWTTSGKVYHITGSLDIQTDVVWGPDVEVLVDADARIEVEESGSLTIKEGVKVLLGDDAYIQVGYGTSGKFIAVGTKEKPVVFTKSSSNQSTWGHDNYAGIILDSKITGDSKLDYCVIEYASAGIYANEIPVKVTNCTIRNNKNYGIQFHSRAMPKDTSTFTGNKISNNGKYPIMISADGVSRLPGDIVFTNNTNNKIYVEGGDVVSSGTWRKQEVPYEIKGRVSIEQPSGVSITIAAGTVCELNEDAYIEVGYGDPGTLIAKGTKDDPIIFTCSVDGAFWGHDHYAGIIISNKATNNTTLQYCRIENATTGVYATGVSALNISNCEIKNNKNNGIIFYDGASPKDSASFVNNVITGNGDYPIVINASVLGKLSGTGSCSGNEKDGIFVNGDVVTDNATWKAHDVPYIVKNRINIENATGVKVTIRPGVAMQFLVDAYLEVGYGEPGTLVANGTAESPIVFSGFVEDSYWGYGVDNEDNSGGIYLSNKTTSSTSLSYCVIERASSGINVEADVSIKNCTIKDNKYYGIILNDDVPTSKIADNTFSGNGSGETLKN